MKPAFLIAIAIAIAFVIILVVLLVGCYWQGERVESLSSVSCQLKREQREIERLESLSRENRQLNKEKERLESLSRENRQLNKEKERLESLIKENRQLNKEKDMFSMRNFSLSRRHPDGTEDFFKGDSFDCPKEAIKDLAQSFKIPPRSPALEHPQARDGRRKLLASLDYY